MKSILVPCLIGLMMAMATACKVQKYPPELWKATPPSGAIGQDIMLNGVQFGDQPSVSFTSIPTSGTSTAPGPTTTASGAVKSSTDASITVTVPRLPIGATQIRVSNQQGITDPIPFVVLQPAPVLTAVTPGNALPGAVVRLTGDYLDQTQNVQFGANIFYPGGNSLTLVNAQTVDITLPLYIPRGGVEVVVVTTGGTAKSSFIVSGTPAITGISPKQVKAGAEVSIQGKYLTDGSVRINGLPAEKTLTTDTEIRAVVPLTATSGRVTITVFDKLVATSTDSLMVVGVPALSPTSLSVTEGIKGDIIALTGVNLLGVTTVLFGDTPAAFRALSNTQLEVTVPDRTASGAVPVTVTSLGGSATSTQTFLFILPPSALTLSPARQARGKEIIVRGQNLTRITAMSINGRSVAITSRTEGAEVRATVPADATTGPVTVTNRAATVNAPQSLTIELPPTLTDYTRKAAVGSRVVLKGTYLLDASIYFSGNSYPAVDDGKNQDTERWVLVTGDAQNGPIRVVNNAGETTTTESFTVLHSISGLDFTPKIAKVGAEITISGLNISDVTDIRFSGGKSVAATFRKSGTLLIATVPAGAVDGTICLTNSTGTVCTTATFSVQLLP